MAVRGRSGLRVVLQRQEAATDDRRRVVRQVNAVVKLAVTLSRRRPQHLQVFRIVRWRRRAQAQERRREQHDGGGDAILRVRKENSTTHVLT